MAASMVIGTRTASFWCILAVQRGDFEAEHPRFVGGHIVMLSLQPYTICDDNRSLHPSDSLSSMKYQDSAIVC